MISFPGCSNKEEITLWQICAFSIINNCVLNIQNTTLNCILCEVLTRLLPPQTKRWPSQCPDRPTYKERSLSGTCKKRGADTPINVCKQSNIVFKYQAKTANHKSHHRVKCSNCLVLPDKQSKTHISWAIIIFFLKGGDLPVPEENI